MDPNVYREGGPAQPAFTLGRILEGKAAMQQEQAVTTQQLLGTLQGQVDQQNRVMEQLAAGQAAPRPAGEAQLAALGLPPTARKIYGDVKKAILDRVGLSGDDHRRSTSAASGRKDARREARPPGQSKGGSSHRTRRIHQRAHRSQPDTGGVIPGSPPEPASFPTHRGDLRRQGRRAGGADNKGISAGSARS
ncbi:uncharacterized protein AB9W97_020901 [Spinachia spinachia]